MFQDTTIDVFCIRCRKMERIKVLELFSGYGGASQGLKLANIPHEIIGYSDIEDCANYIYKLNHCPEDVDDKLKLGDITKIDPEKLEDFDLCTFGFPCTDVSNAGLRDLSRGKTNLFFEAIRIIKNKKPRWLLAENVQGILSMNNGEFMERVLQEFKNIGYHVQWKLLFSKQHGTPQNRPRVWFVCFRDYEDYESFVFPDKEKLKIIVKDLLDDVVDEKYYLNENQLKKIGTYYQKTNNEEICSTITASDNLKRAKHMNLIKTQNNIIADFRYDEGLRVRKDGLSPTLVCSSMPILYDVYNKKLNNNNISSTLGQNCGTITGISGQVIITGLQEHQQVKTDGVMSTLNSAMGLGGGHTPIINTIKTGYGRQGSSKEFIAINEQVKEVTGKWRRLTPRECFRIMGDFEDNIKFGNLSDSRLYFLAGNGWDVNLVSKIFTQMFTGNKLNKQKTFADF